MYFDREAHAIVGQHGSLEVPNQDEVARKLAMLIEGQCEGLGPTRAARAYGYTRQRYFQLLHRFSQEGAAALASQRRGPKTNYRRTGELTRQVIRYRFLDPEASPEVIAQKLRQTGFTISMRSVSRVIADYGLQKKTLRVPPPLRAARGRGGAGQQETNQAPAVRSRQPGTRRTPNPRR